MPRLRTLAILATDLLLLLLSYLVATKLLIDFGVLPDQTLETYLMLDGALLPILVLVFSLLFGFYFLGLYENFSLTSRLKIVEDVTLVFGGAFLIQALVSYSKSTLVVSRWVMLSGSLLAAVSFCVWRLIYYHLLLRLVVREKVFFVGTTPLVRQLVREILECPDLGYALAGYTAEKPDGTMPENLFFPQDTSLEDRVLELKPDRICAVMPLKDDPAMASRLLNWSMKGLNVQTVGDLYEDIYQRISLENIGIDELMFSPDFRQDRWTTRLQAIYSYVIAAAGLLLTAPIMALTALAVRLDSAGPVLFRQTRIGQDGKAFTFLKFRSMYTDADKLTGPVRAKANDSRITRVGRFIRLSRIDELPQLINVLRGEMTLVGPRPEMPEFEQELVHQITLYPQRHRVKPGITGWAQIHHVPEDSLDNTKRKLEYDLYYIKHLSPMLDFLTMFHTFKTIVMRIGAR